MSVVRIHSHNHTPTKLDTSDTVLAAAPGSGVACIGFSDSDWDGFREAWDNGCWPTTRLGTLHDLFELFENATPEAIVVRVAGNLDPVRILEVARFAGKRVPTYLVTSTRTEAMFYAQRAELAPVATFEAPFSSQHAAIVRGACRAARMEALPGGVGRAHTPRKLAELFFRLQITEFTGRLELRHGSTERTLFWRQGHLRSAASNLLSENLGQRLMARGVIDEVHYEWAQRLQQREGILQGEALLKIGVLTPRALSEALREHVRTKILNAFVPQATEYELVATEDAAFPPEHFVYDLFGIVVDGLHQTQSDAEVEVDWCARADSHVCLQPVHPSIWAEAVRHLGPSASDALRLGIRADSLLDPSTPQRLRLATLDALVTGGLAVLTDGPLQGVHIASHLAVIDDEEGEERGGEEDPEWCEQISQRFLELRSSHDHEILQVAPDASQDVIEEGYRKLRSALLSRPRSSRQVEEQVSCILLRADRARAMLSRSQMSGPIECKPSPRHGRVQRRDVSFSAENAYRAGMRSLKSGDLESALAYVRRAVESNPNEPLYTLYDAWVRFQTEEPGSRAARQAHHDVVEIARDNPLLGESHYLLARIALIDGHKVSAVEHLRTALRHKPRLRDAASLLEKLAGESQVERTRTPTSSSLAVPVLGLRATR